MDSNVVKDSKIIIYPRILSWILIAIAVVLAIIIYSFHEINSFSNPHPSSVLVTSSWFICFFGFLCVMLVCQSLHCRIIITKDLVILPETAYEGAPSIYMWGKKKLDIGTIKRIKRCPHGVYGWGPEFLPSSGKTVPGFLVSPKIIIVSKPGEAVSLAHSYFGEEQLEKLILEIESRNKSVEIVEG